MKAGFACGSMVRFLFFTKMLHSVQHFCEKENFFRPAGGDIPHQTRDHLIHVSIGRFAGFAHVVLFVVQTPTA